MIAKALRTSGGARAAAATTRIAGALLVVLLTGGAGCYDPHIGEGTLRCNEKLCPDGFYCHADGFCWSQREGDSPGADASGVSNGAAGSGAGVTDRTPDSGVGGGRGGGVGGSGTLIGGGGVGGSGTVVGAGGTGGSGTMPGGGGAGHPPADPDSGVVAPDSGGNRPDVPVVTGTGGAGPGRLMNGAACDRDDACDSGHCVDQVCCDGPCPGKCQACDVSGFVGRCSQVVGQQPHGNRGACGSPGMCAGLCSTVPDRCTFPGGETVCRQATCQSATFTAAATCNGAGACPPASSQSCGDFQCNPAQSACLTTCAADADCAPSKPYCSQGACVPHRKRGDSCQTAGECEGGHCVDGVCCDSACQGQCQNCALNGSRGTCSLVTSGQPRNRPACGGSSKECAGYCSGAPSGECTFPGTSVSCQCGGLLGLGACNSDGACHTLGLGGLGAICL